MIVYIEMPIGSIGKLPEPICELVVKVKKINSFYIVATSNYGE